jgi:hypothetical protein
MWMTFRYYDGWECSIEGRAHRWEVLDPTMKVFCLKFEPFHEGCKVIMWWATCLGTHPKSKVRYALLWILCKNVGPKIVLLSQISMFSLFFIQSLLYNGWSSPLNPLPKCWAKFLFCWVKSACFHFFSSKSLLYNTWVVELLLRKVKYMYEWAPIIFWKRPTRHHTRYTQNLIVQNHGKLFFCISHPQITLRNLLVVVRV